MINKKIVRQLSVLTIISLILTAIIYNINFLILPHPGMNGSGYVKPFSAIDALFVEGIVLVIMGALDFLASGISYGSRQATGTVAVAKDIFENTVEVGPSEMLRKNTWKKLGLMSVGSVAIITGAFLLLIYFLSLR